jgi:UDP-3-O-[3-hydroxymyristoyl] glucosamine N-acyltransferase
MEAINLTVSQLAQRLGGVVEGDGGQTLTGMESIELAGPGHVTFVVKAGPKHSLSACRAGAAIVAVDHPPAGVPLIRVGDVKLAVATVLAMLGDDEDLPPVGIHPTAVIAASAVLGKGVAVGPHVVIGKGARIGDGAVICANACIAAGVVLGDETVVFEGTVIHRRVRVGKRCRLGPCAVIGAAGFGYDFVGGKHVRVMHAGGVEIGDDVDIRACACVDRGKFGATRIGDNTKIDNQVQVAHNCRIGRGAILAGQVGLAGSVTLGNYVMMGGSAGAVNGLTVGDGARLGAWCAASEDVAAGAEVTGHPPRTWRRTVRAWRDIDNLPDLYAQVRLLEKRLKELEQTKDH